VNHQSLKQLFTAALCALALADAAALEPRQHVLVVGSSTTYPIIAAAAERFGRRAGVATPVVEATGTGGGFKLFCAGLGPSTPDVVMASRPLKPSERRECDANGVGDIREIKLGYDGIVIVNQKRGPKLHLDKRELWLAIAKRVPAAGDTGELVDNPYRNWRDIDPELPDLPIRVLGPPPTSGTRDILLERLLRRACAALPALAAIAARSEADFEAACYRLREDGLFVNAGENDARLVRKVVDDADAVAILGYNFLDRNRERLQAATIEGVEPAFELIESGAYPLSRPLYVYAKPQHATRVPHLDAFLDELTAAHSAGPGGYLVDKGLIPLR
jgi:phosphate transport system substrate-binding protein